MRGLWLEEKRLAFRDDLPGPPRADGEAVVRVRLAGICGTDLELLRGYYPFTGVPGHEFVGIVEEAPSAPEWIGRRVVGEINAACGTCATCLAGRRTHCPARTVLGIRGRAGAFAERLALPLLNLHEVPAAVPDEEAVFTEPLAAALQIQAQVPLRADQRVLVLGAGRLGSLVARTLARTGAQVRVAARLATRRDQLRAAGVDAVAPEEVRAGSADVVVDCTGHPEGFARARAAVRARGTIVLKSTYAGEAPVNLSSVVVDEITVVGSRCGAFAPALELLAADVLPVRDLVQARYPLARGPDAFAEAARPGALKVLLEA
ncbi:MAG TPA: alcohol dehydrogenase catalytic domain-containing protein [Vicinamibacteria bacterium]|jgi:threonine dehydrogenase-like Zn-dependent dehydrogenase